MANDFFKIKKGLNLPSYATVAEVLAIPNPEVGDVALVAGSAVYSYNGSNWVDTGSSGSVTSVNGQSGVVQLDSADIPEDTNLYFTDARAKTAAVVDSSAGSQTDQAMSVSAGKSYTNSSVASEASLRSAADTTLQNNIDAEASTRASADTTLQTNITAEETARIAAVSAEASTRASADTTLQNNIDAEASTRASADTTLQTNITAEETARIAAVSAEATTRANADTTLQNNIDAEASTRASADATLQTNITAEETARIAAVSAEATTRASADTTLQNNIDAEASTRASADTTLQNNIDAEAASRASADTTLQTNITAEENARIAAVSAEATTRAAADTTLQGNIDAEESARISADNTLQGNINSEASARSAADTTLQNNITAEASTRAANDLTLQGNIDAEASTRASADTTLQTNITAEENARIAAVSAEATTRANADTTLQNNIDAEASSRASADTTLQSNIDAEASTRTSADTTLQSNIDAEASARVAADALLIPLTQKGSASGVATLDGSGKIPSSQLPPLSITSVTVVATIAERDALTPQEGDFCIVTDVNETFIYSGTAWIELIETSGVTSVNGLPGPAVSLSTDNISEGGSNLYFTDGRAKTAAVVNSSAGSETDQAMSVAAAKAYTDSSVASEASLRSSADSTLQNNITAEENARIAAVSAEATARANADTTLQNNIDAEASTRASADSTLQTNITAEETARIAAVSAEATARTNADTTLQNNIDAEAATRASADTTLQINITAEENARIAAVSAEASTRASADTTLQNNIDAEESARIAAVSAEATARTNADTTLQNNIDAEASTRASADTTLQNNIDTEESARIAAVSAEATARANADTTLQNNIDAEASTRASADTTLQNNIDTEESARIAAVSAEATTRASADTTLQNNIDAEASSRASADGVLQSNINSEASTRAAADTTLQNNIDAEASARAAADALLIPLTQKAAANGVATLDGSGKIPSTQIPAIAITSVSVVQTIAQRDALTVEEGDVCVVTDVNESFIYNGSAWIELSTTDNVTSVNGQPGPVINLTTDNIGEGSANLYFTDGRAKSAAVINSMSGSETDQAPSVSSAKGAIQFRPEFTRYVAKNGSDSTGNGSPLAPYYTIQAAMDSLPAAVPGSNVEDYAIYIYPGVYNETITWTRSNTHLIGLQAPRKNIQTVSISGGIDFAIVNAEIGGMFNNVSSISNCLLAIRSDQTRNVLNFNGSEQVILQLLNCQVYQNIAGYSAISMNNTAASLSRLYLDNTAVQCIGNTTGHAIDLVKGNIFSAFNCEIYRTSSSDTSVRAIKLSNNSSVSSLSNATLVSSGDYVVEMGGTGNFTMSLTLIQNTSANKSGIYINSGTVLTSLDCVYTVPAGSGFAITGGVGSVLAYASNVYTANSSVGSSVVKSQLATDTTTSVITEGSRLYFTDARAKTAAVVNSSAGSETDQAMSVAAAKAYTDSAGSSLQTNIDAEASARAAADTTLQNNINSEASTRAAADTTLQNNIDSEASARAAADALLIPLTQKAQSNGVATLDGAGKVPVAQIPFDASPVTSVNTETGDVVLDTDDVDEGLNNKYFTDGRARTAAVVNSSAGTETSQAASVSAMKSYVASSSPVLSVNSVTGVVELDSGEIPEGSNLYFTDTRAKTAAVVNSSSGSEVDQAMSVAAGKAYTDSAVSAEATLRSNADTTLQSNIDAEASTRASADSTLQSNINAEASARAAADALLIPLTQKAAVNGVATLDGSGKIPSSQLPPLSITSVTVVATIAERDALTPQEGDFCVVTDANETYIYSGSAWVEILETSGVTSVNTLSGNVTLTSDNIGEGSTNLYFTDARAKTSTVVNSSSGSQTDQAMSVAAGKAYTNSAVNTEALARQSGDSLLVPLSQKAAPNGVATLDVNGLIPVTQIPAVTVPVTSVNTQTGDVVLTTTDVNEGTRQYFTTTRARTAAVVNSTAGAETTQAASVSAMKSYVASSSPVLSVNDLTGTVVLTTAEITEDPLGSNLYFTTARARTAAVINSTAGAETNQAPSVSAMKSYIAANTISGVIRYGTSAMASSTDTFTVNFSDIGSTSYVVIITISNGVDAGVRHLSPTVTTKTSNSFTFITHQTTDSANYVANYYIIKL